MPITVVVGARDCLSSIAFEHGHSWRTLWDHPDNAALRAARTSAHVLRQGDRVVVPERRPKEEEAATGKRHTFRRKGVPEQLRIRFGTPEFPRAGVPYVLTIDGDPLPGKTDANGELVCFLRPNARDAELVLRPEDAPEEHYAVGLRELDPIDTVRGLKHRLRNLGYLGGSTGDDLDPATIGAMHDFQARSGLPRTDAPDDATRAALLSAHGC
ncbi:peptidoglycan-binding domain-containing protein [Sorangium sp. So ce590]|uniref:peptidoglycan-binding domain-containing protein n=1 Tax=Sorangium sp. So ce590 TaxID=3133317 RepID=UPI003F611F9C